MLPNLLPSNRHALHELVVFLLLVAIGVAGRWGQPVWCFTPIAAATVFAGFYFARWPIAALVPVASLSLSDQWLPGYDHGIVLLATYGVMTVPVWLGRALRSGGSRARLASLGLACGLVPATTFYVVTNFAVWSSTSMYAATAGGLLDCYWAAVPFYRWMLAGDLCYLTALLGCYVLATRTWRVANRANASA